MSWSLGSIFVELTCNTGKFLTGMEKGSQAARKTGRDIRGAFAGIGESIAALGPGAQRVGFLLEGIGDKAAGVFDIAAAKGRGLGVALSGSVLGGVTALAGGMFALAEHAADVGSKIFESSEKTGIAAGQMSGLMAVAKQVNGNFDALTTSLARAGANLEKTAEGGGKANQALFQMMGGAKGAAELGLKPMGDRIQAVLAHIFALQDAGQRNLALNQMLGRGWQENVGTLKVLAEQGFGPAIAKAKEFGIYFDAAHAKQAKEFEIAINQLKGQLSAIGLVVGKEVIPKVIDLAQAMQGLGAMIDRMKSPSSMLVSLSGPLGPLIAAFLSAKEASKDTEQAQTDFLTSLDALTGGAGKAADGEGKLAGAVKEHADALAGLIERERDEISALDNNNNAKRAAYSEYDREMSAIQKAIAAGGSLTEGVQAQGLAVDVLNRKLDIYNERILDATKFSVPAGAPWGKLPAAPELTIPSNAALPSALGGGLPNLSLTLSQLTQLQGKLDGTHGIFKALREETELSDASFKKLAAAFPGLTEAEVTATAAGRRMIAQLTQFDKFGTAAEQFTEFKNALIADGNDLAGHLIKDLGGALDSIEGQLAHLAVTGKANFKQMWQGIEENLVKTGLQKGASSILGHFGMHAGGGRPDGSQGNPLYVKMAGGVGGIGAGIGAVAGAGGGGNASHGSGGAGSGLSGLIGSVGSLFKSFTSLFGGFLAGGGDVTPGKAYVVGERHPEFFIPHASGAVVPSLTSQQLRPLNYTAHYHINTPDADSFRRSQAQITTEAVRYMMREHARNS